MHLFENHDIEYKEMYIPDVKKEVIAFANTDGGTLYIGIRKDSTVAGVDNPDQVMLQAASALKDSIRPDVMSFVKIETIAKDGKYVVKISVQPGTGKPYYLHEKGLKPSGVYVRKGSSCQPLSDEGIREMILDTSGKSFEKERSMIQSLTFDTLEREMEKRNIEFNKIQMRTLQLLSEDGLYTNLGLLLSEQCEHTIKIAVFQGADNAVFKTRKEFTGSLIKQLHDVYEQIDYYNPTSATFQGLDRFDKRAYAEETIREALLNSIVHRDYSFSGSTIINIYDDRIEFVSLGGLVSGLTMESIFMGLSQSRNPNLAAVFYRMRLIESYGTGIQKIRRAYSDNDKQPIFESAPGGFRLTLPNQISEKHPSRPCDKTSTEKISYKELPENHKKKTTVTKANLTRLQTSEECILNHVNEHGYISRREAEQLLGVKSTRVYTILKGMCDNQLLKRIGKGRSVTYIQNKG